MITITIFTHRDIQNNIKAHAGIDNTYSSFEFCLYGELLTPGLGGRE